MSEPFFDIKEEEHTANYARLVISPLAQGYGQTLGNSLRRVLLTSLPGAAVTSVRMASVKHQFSTLKGMKEDVVEFVLNLKKVKFHYEGDKPFNASLSVTGPADVYARDIQLDPSVTVANPDQLLAVLSAGGKLDAKIEIESGTGYSPAEERATGEIGLIPMDAAFSSITRVNYRVEETRVGRVTNYDKLILEIWADGTIDPREALVKAAEILVSYYQQIVSPKAAEVVETKPDSGLGALGKLSVEEIGLPTRVANALIKSEYETVEDLVSANRDNLVKVRNLGEKSVKIIDAALGERGLEIGSGK